MFEQYYFEDPRDQSRWVKVGHGSYVAAALIGSVYVLWKAGAGAFVSALPAHLLLSGALVALTAVTSIALPEIQQLLALIVAIPAILTVQSQMMIKIIHKSYRRRGWLVDTVV